MPDTKEGGLRVREPGRVASSAQTQSEVMVPKHQGNEKHYLFLGTIIGLIVPFAVKDIAEASRRILNM